MGGVCRVNLLVGRSRGRSKVGFYMSWLSFKVVTVVIMVAAGYGLLFGWRIKPQYTTSSPSETLGERQCTPLQTAAETLKNSLDALKKDMPRRPPSPGCRGRKARCGANPWHPTGTRGAASSTHRTKCEVLPKESIT